ncbi:MAG: TRAP transporter small permease [Gammaproteobacteria bacterium]|nr:TRAP transporter small permease [Gammaproteobacteria bacterium]MBU1653805.1 TRAP transporter small permease [Gammaproteobacteria bacterium]MBU1961717.1 TRAP transporter small permease [Gammaproteobacteria bacterium]
MGLSSLAHRVHRIAVLVEDGILAALLTSMIVLAFLQIALRNLADMTISWGDPLLRVMVLWIALFGAIAATRDGNHIHMDIIARFLPDRLRQPLQRFTDLFSAFICGLLGWHGAQLVILEQQDGTIAFNGIPTWTLELILPFGFCVMSVRFLVNAFFPRAKEPAKCS